MLNLKISQKPKILTISIEFNRVVLNLTEQIRLILKIAKLRLTSKQSLAGLDCFSMD